MFGILTFFPHFIFLDCFPIEGTLSQVQPSEHKGKSVEGLRDQDGQSLGPGCADTSVASQVP